MISYSTQVLQPPTAVDLQSATSPLYPTHVTGFKYLIILNILFCQFSTLYHFPIQLPLIMIFFGVYQPQRNGHTSNPPQWNSHPLSQRSPFFFHGTFKLTINISLNFINPYCLISILYHFHLLQNPSLSWFYDPWASLPLVGDYDVVTPPSPFHAAGTSPAADGDWGPHINSTHQ